MLITVSLLVVAAAVALPNATEFLRQHQFSSATNQVALEVARARMQAISQNRAVRVAVGSSGSEICRLTAPAAAGPWTPASCAQAGDAIDLPGATVASGTFPTFGGTGLAQTASSIQLSNADRYRTLNVNILGRVSIQ